MPLLRSMALFSAVHHWQRSYLGLFLELMESALAPSYCSTLEGSHRGLSASCLDPSTILETQQVCVALFKFVNSQNLNEAAVMR